MDEEDVVLTCPKCGWVDERYFCDLTFSSHKTVDGELIEITEFLCPDCGTVIHTEEDEAYSIGPMYGDHNPDHADWDSGDYGNYGGD